MDINLTAAIIAAAAGVVGTLITQWITQALRKSEIEENQATAADQVSSAWEKLNRSLVARVECLENRIQEMEQGQLDRDKTIEAQRQRIQELETEVDTLRQQVKELGGNPRTRRKRENGEE